MKILINTNLFRMVGDREHTVDLFHALLSPADVISAPYHCFKGNLKALQDLHPDFVFDHLIGAGKSVLFFSQDVWSVWKEFDWEKLIDPEMGKLIDLPLLRENMKYHRPGEKINRLEYARYNIVITGDDGGFHDLIRPLFPRSKLIHLPQSVPDAVYRNDYGLSRIHDVSMIGQPYQWRTMNNFYPLRHVMANEMMKAQIHFNWPLLPIPPVHYARTLAQTKILCFDGTVFNLHVSKYFESMACGCLAMAPLPKDADKLNFKDGYNMVAVTAENFLDKLRYYLCHDSERQEIAWNGAETVKKYHTSAIRAKQLIEILEKEKL